MTVRTICTACIATLLAGCATQAAAPRVDPAPMVADNFCETAKKRTWSTRDTPETIREAVAWNRAIDKRCGVPVG